MAVETLVSARQDSSEPAAAVSSKEIDSRISWRNVPTTAPPGRSPSASALDRRGGPTSRCTSSDSIGRGVIGPVPLHPGVGGDLAGPMPLAETGELG